MKSHANKVIFISLFLLTFSYSFAQPYIANQEEPIIYPKAQYAPKIDGLVDSLWYNAPRYPMVAEIINYVEPDDWYDASGEWRAMWDNDFLYFLVDIRDDQFLVGMDWNWDSVELYSDADYSHETTYDGIDDVQLRFHLDDDTRSITVYTSDKGPEFETSDFVWEQEYTDLGWRLEVAMPLVDLFIDRDPGTIIGTECQYNDNDDGTATQHKLIAFGNVEEHWGNPSLFGSAKLSDYLASDTLMVLRTKTQPTIDGVLDDVWKDVPAISASGYIDFNKVDNLYDLSMTFRTMWDESYLYYFVTVWDDMLMRDGEGDHNDDGVEIYSDGDYSHGTTFDNKNDLQFAFRYEESDQLIQTVHLTGSSAGTAVDLSGIQQAAKLMGNEGFTLEVSFPISECLGMSPMPGYIFGIEVDYNDDDDGDTRDTKLKTYSQADDTWQNPSEMIPAKLVSQPSVIVEKDQAEYIPDTFLCQNYPNPFNPYTTIVYRVVERSFVRLSVYDMLGKIVTVLVDEKKEPGQYQVKFDGTELPNGMYFYKYEAGSYSQTHKMILLK